MNRISDILGKVASPKGRKRKLAGHRRHRGRGRRRILSEQLESRQLLAGDLCINEVLFDVPGDDAPSEYVELRGTPGATIDAGTYLVNIEGDSDSGFSPGKVSNVFDLSGLMLGSNGFLVISQNGSGYSIDASAAQLTSTTSDFNGLGARFASDTALGEIENASNSFLLVQSPVAPDASDTGDDIDADDNGIVDGSLATSWTVLDSVGVLDGDAGDISYADVTFTLVGSGYVGRLGDSTGNTANDWVGAEVTGTAPDFTLSETTVFPTSLAGSPLDHLGAANPGTPVASNFVINELRISHVSLDNASNNFVEFYETSGGAGISLDGLALIVLTGETDDSVPPSFTAGDLSFAYDLSGGLTDSNGFALLHDDGSQATLDVGDIEADVDFFGSPSTFLLVSGFTDFDLVGQVDLDPDDDGNLDTVPWDQVLDSVSLFDEDGDDLPSVNYSTTTVGPPEGGPPQFTAAAIGRDVDGAGTFEVLGGADTFTDDSEDTPGQTNNPAVALTETDGNTGVIEGVKTDTVEIVLTGEPSENVTIQFTSADGETTTNPSSVVFSPTDWFTPQVITVTAVEDGETEGLHQGVITVASTSGDSDFDGLLIPDIAVTINDIVVDSSNVVINELRISHSEDDNESNNFVEVYDTTGAAGTSLDGLALIVLSERFNPGAIDFVYPLETGSTDSSGFALIHDDGLDPAIERDPGDLEFSDLDFFGSPTTFALVTGFTGVQGQDLDSDDDGAFDVAAPWVSVIDAVTLLDGSDDGGFAGGFGISSDFVFSGDEFAPSGARRVPDGSGDFAKLFFNDSTQDTPGGSNQLPPAIRVVDLGVDVSELPEGVLPGTVADLVVSERGLTDTFEVVLDAPPSANVTIAVVPDDQMTVEGSGELIFTPDNWDTPQAVTVGASDDEAEEGDHTGTVSLSVTSSGPQYASVADLTLSSDVVDDDHPNHVVVINEINKDPGELGDANGDGVTSPVDDEFVEVLNTGSGVIDLSGWSISDEFQIRHVFEAGTVLAPGQAIVVFGGGTLGTYGNSQAVVASTGGLGLSNDSDTVTLFDGTRIIDTYSWNVDNNADGLFNDGVDQSLARELDGTGEFKDQFDFVSVLTFDVTPGVSNVDGSEFVLEPAVLVTQSGGETVVTEGGASDSFEVVLTTEPTANVIVSVTVADGETTVDTGSLTFTPSGGASPWNAPQTVTVTAVDDPDFEGDHLSTVDLAATSSDPTYNGLSFPGVQVAVVDNDGDDPVVSNAAIINEFVADHDGNDSDAFVEILATATTGPTDLSGLTLLEIEGDFSETGTGEGTIDKVIPLGITGGDGYQVLDVDAENGTITLLLVEGFTGEVGQDLDTDDDGNFEVTPWSAIVDSVATVENADEDFVYGGAPALTPGLDGNSFQYGGASRIPNATDTDTVADWVRNDFDGAGLPSFPDATADSGEAVNTPGTANLVAADVTPPTITDVIVSSSASWSPAFVDAVDGGGAGDGNGLGISLPGADQLTPLSVGGIDQIYVQFSEDVGAVAASQIALSGVAVADYSPLISGVTYDGSTQRALIELSASIVNDKLLLSIADTVNDAAGNALDGDWTDGVSIESGNESAGGQFNFRFNVLVGDANGDGSTNGGDLPAFAASFNQSTGQAAYDPRADWNGDGSVNGGDLPLFAGNFNQSLPADDPVVPSFASSGGGAGTGSGGAENLVDAVFGELASEEGMNLLSDI